MRLVLGAGHPAASYRGVFAMNAERHLLRVWLVGLEARLEAPALPLGHHVDPAVHDQDDGQRHVEGAQSREEHVARLLVDLADGLILRGRLPPAEEGPDGDDQRERPDAEQGHEAPLLGDDGGVAQRIAHADVAVDGDDAESHDGSRAAQDVHRRPDIAEDPAEGPVAQDLEDSGEGQHRGSEEKVGHRQVDYVVVCDRVQVPVAGHGKDHEDVPQHPEKDEAPQDHPEQNGLGNVQRWRRVGAVGAVGGISGEKHHGPSPPGPGPAKSGSWGPPLGGRGGGERGSGESKALGSQEPRLLGLSVGKRERARRKQPRPARETLSRPRKGVGL